MFKWLPILIFTFLVPGIVSAQAVIVSHDYDPAKNKVTLHMLNQSGKDITAYDIAVTETYPGSKVPHTHWVGSEMVGVMLSIVDPTDIHHQDAIENEHGGNGTWQTGTTRDEFVGVGPGLLTIEPVFDAVIYADRTADSTNPDALKRLLDARRNYAASLETGSQAIRKALANPNDPSPQETARKEIEPVGKTLAGSGGGGAVALDLENVPKLAEQTGKSIREALNDLATHYNHRAALMREHANVTVEGAK